MGNIISDIFTKSVMAWLPSHFYRFENEHPIDIDYELCHPRTVVNEFVEKHHSDMYLVPSFIKINLLEDFINFWETRHLKRNINPL